MSCSIMDGKLITLTRGDTLKVQVKILKDGKPYQPKDGDVVRFAMKEDYSEAEPLINKVIPNDTLLLQLDPADTKGLKYRTYVYDIEITFGETGAVDTFIPKGKLTISEEVH